MKKKQLLKKLKSIKLMLEVHPHNEPNSEFEDRILDLDEIISELIISDIKDKKSFYCQTYINDGFSTKEEKCKNQCEFCVNAGKNGK